MMENISPENRTNVKFVHEVYLGEFAQYAVDRGNGFEFFVRQTAGRNIDVNDIVTVHFQANNTTALIEE